MQMLSTFVRKFAGRKSGDDDLAPEQQDRRRYARAQVRMEVIVDAHGQRVAGSVRDVSISGTLLTVDMPLAIGDAVSIEIERLSMPIKAKVVRLSGDDFGLAFVDPGVGVLFAGWSRGSEVQDDANGNS